MQNLVLVYGMMEATKALSGMACGRGEKGVGWARLGGRVGRAHTGRKKGTRRHMRA